MFRLYKFLDTKVAFFSAVKVFLHASVNIVCLSNVVKRVVIITIPITYVYVVTRESILKVHKVVDIIGISCIRCAYYFKCSVMCHDNIIPFVNYIFVNSIVIKKLYQIYFRGC